jgi:hypothetical protein
MGNGREGKMMVKAESTNVEISMVTLDKRRMTKSIFKQIPVEGFFDFHGKIKGDLLGTVNYEIHDVDKHVLWIKDGELRRCTAITKAGTRCKRTAVSGSTKCWQHK